MGESSVATAWERIADYEQVAFCHDPPSGLRAIIAIHSTALGPSLGGTRFHVYPSEEAALEDVLDLARAMTYKSALAGLDLGGGKAVIIGDPARDKSDELLRVYGRFVDSLSGRYLTAEDVGTTQRDMDLIALETRCVVGTSPELGGSGDPSEATAHGLWWATRAVAGVLAAGDGGTSPHGDAADAGLEGVRVVVSGVGKVGSALVGLLVESGAKVTVSDVDPGAVRRLVEDLGVTAVDVASAHTVECDIFSPCALGGVLNPTTIPALRCQAVVGAANNQLSSDGDAETLAERGVLYAPDFLVNAGGVINLAHEIAGYQREKALSAVRSIGTTVIDVLERASRDGTTTVVAARAMAEARVAAARTERIRRFPRPGAPAGARVG